MGLGKLFKVCRDGDRALQLLLLNEEFLVRAVHQTALIEYLPFVHTARRSYRLDGPVRTQDGGRARLRASVATLQPEFVQILPFRGRRLSFGSVCVG